MGVDRHFHFRSFNGIGDLLFLTPTLKVLAENFTTESFEISVDTPHWEFLIDSPYVNYINDGIKSIPSYNLNKAYPDPIHCKWPTKHHVYSVFDSVCKYYEIELPLPELKPEIHNDSILKIPELENKILVQVMHKGHWHEKKVWPNFETLTQYENFYPIKRTKNLTMLISFIASCKGVVCAEGGISHIAKALNKPAVVVYGGFANPEWNGYDDQINLCNEKHCSYCYNPRPCVHPLEERLCMKEITVDDVILATMGFSKFAPCETHNQIQFIKQKALQWCRGTGLDIGAGKSPLDDSIPIEDNNEENAYKLKREDESMDYVFSSHCLEHLDDPKKALSEWTRVLKQEGILYLYLPSQNYIPWRKESMPKWHKTNWNINKIIKLIQELKSYKILEVVGQDLHFGIVVVARKEFRLCLGKAE